ncbi:MAG TPA: 50S ribosomal protein L24 [Candidatus Dormibacteraeota bacterium]|nr:50S ribosomal protein L24 [Candidatus Dormibacteraeota bacterium]
MRENTREIPPMGIRHGDTVKVMSGRSKGKTGKVLSVNPAKNTVTVERANIIKKHTRANPSKNVRGGILDKEGPIHVSNVMLVCPGCGKHTRAGHSKLPDGTKVRVCRRCNQTFES